jgi:hypothetical protein
VLSVDVLNKEDSDSAISSLRFYINDGVLGEIATKAQGIQSISIIALFAGWCKFRAENNQKKLSEDQKMWSTVLAIEEPELHIHFPIRNKLLRLLKEDFLDVGAQVILSTHDSTFLNWNYISDANLIFPQSIYKQRIKTLQHTQLNEFEQRIVRYSGSSFFTDIVLMSSTQFIEHMFLRYAKL